MKFTDVDVDPTDSLQVVNLHSIASLTPTGGVTTPMSLYIHHNQTFIAFTSDNDVAKNGFQFSFEFVGKDWMNMISV